MTAHSAVHRCRSMQYAWCAQLKWTHAKMALNVLQAMQTKLELQPNQSFIRLCLQKPHLETLSPRNGKTQTCMSAQQLHYVCTLQHSQFILTALFTNCMQRLHIQHSSSNNTWGTLCKCQCSVVKKQRAEWLLTRGVGCSICCLSLKGEGRLLREARSSHLCQNCKSRVVIIAQILTQLGINKYQHTISLHCIIPAQWIVLIATSQAA